MTDFLCARPSVLEEADRIAFDSDWFAVYGDMHAAYNSTAWQLDPTRNTD